jgi:hypothetical protein
MKFSFNSSIIGPDNRGSTVEECGGIRHVKDHYVRKIENNWATPDLVYDPFFSGYSGPTGLIEPALLTITGTTSINSWVQHTADISAYASATVRIIFWYAQGSSFTGDIQIDDIELDGNFYSFEGSNHDFLKNNTSLPNGYGTGNLASNYPIINKGILTTGTTGGQWNIDTGGTPSGNTGSTIDHTLGTTSGSYVYAETSGPTNNRPFLLETPDVELSASPGNLTFWTSRFGATMGTLSVYMYVVE